MDAPPNHNQAKTLQGTSPLNGSLQIESQIPPQMMNIVGDPALMAAAAATSFYPTPAMFNNPSAFYAMPQMFVSPGMQVATASNTTAEAASGEVPATPMVGSHHTIQTGFNRGSFQTNGPSNAWPQPMLVTSSGFQGAMDRSLQNVNASTAMQVQLAAAAAAAAAVPNATSAGATSDGSGASNHKMTDLLTAEEKAKQNRDRNREHARSTRLRKKAYVQKLKEVVEGLHAERTEEERNRRVAIQHLAEKQGVRRAVVRSFLRFHSNFESDPRKWMTILEDNFWFKQPVTPYRAFPREEIEQECRVTHGIDGVIADAASLSVMVEGIGSRSTRWMQIKRDDVINRGSASTGAESFPHSIVQRNNRYQHAISSLSSSSGSSSCSAEQECRRRLKRPHSQTTSQPPSGTTEDSKSDNPKKVSSSGSSNDSSDQQKRSNDFHVYNAPSLPDPKLDSESSNPNDDSQGESGNSSGGEADGVKQVSTDSSSGEEDKLSDSAVKTSFPKRRKVTDNGSSTVGSAAVASETAVTSLPAFPMRTGLPANIAKSGGISHNVRPVATFAVGNGSARLGLAPPTPLPPFLGIGKRAHVVGPTTTTVGVVDFRANASTAVQQGVALSLERCHEPVQSSVCQPTTVTLDRFSSISQPGAGSNSEGVGKNTTASVLISADADASSSNSSSQSGKIHAYYHVNEDDMLLTEDVLMCPFIFRSQDAVICGALADCIMPGMLRAHFSPRNKLMSLEMVYDAMGFMQQLERASGSEGTAQIVPGSLEMALSPTANEPRVITMAESPHLILSVNAAWTKMTKYTQMEVEGLDLSILNGTRTDADASVRPGKSPHKFSDVAKGRCACSTNILYNKEGNEFVAYACSYPLTNSEGAITHVLHVYRELPIPSPPHAFSDPNGRDGAEPMNTQ